MNYYQIIPADSNYRGSELTYSSDRTLEIGQVVRVEIRKKNILGFVYGKTTKPPFTTKTLTDIIKSLVLPVSSVELYRLVNNYYPGYSGAIGQLIVPSYLGRSKIDVEDNKIYDKEQKALPALNDEQQKAYDQISKPTDKASTFIVHGETGSGKTRLYIELAKSEISNGKSVVILTPEISLTEPMYRQFIEVFGNIAQINHSNLTDKQRFNNWTKTNSSTGPQILIGPRSTIFMPLNNIGLIIIDEFHDQSYKQDSAPYYNALRVASILSSIKNSKLIMGSATPSVSEYFIAEQKNIPIIRIINQAVTNKPAVTNYQFIDLTRQEEKSRYPLLSNSLIKSIGQQMAKGKQSLIFINKRGSARSIVCQNCGWRAVCLNCELPLTYHEDRHSLLCHTCGYTSKPPKNCPSCKSADVIFKNPGTKMIAQNLSKMFPSANIVRFDKDNKKSERIENNYQVLTSGDADIIVGTQLITKGHDLANLSLVAVLQAETGLDFPDFNSEEKSYQLIRQIMGRVNRGHTPGLVLLQSFDPLNPALKYSSSGNWKDFYTLQLKQRKQHGFPPFCHALKIEASRKSAKSAQKTLVTLVEKIKSQDDKLEIFGPSPSFIEKRSGNYHWQIIVSSKNRQKLTEIVKNLGGNFRANLDPVNFL